MKKLKKRNLVIITLIFTLLFSSNATVYANYSITTDWYSISSAKNMNIYTDNAMGTSDYYFTLHVQDNNNQMVYFTLQNITKNTPPQEVKTRNSYFVRLEANCRYYLVCTSLVSGSWQIMNSSGVSNIER